VPVTWFAHQVPVLPIARRWPNHTDGVALVIGSMAPDMAYVLDGSRFRIWAHAFPGLVTFNVPITIVVAWIVVQVLAPVVPAHLPSLASFRLRDYQGLATHRFRLVPLVSSAFLGALTHAGLDHLTHEWGWLATHLDWYNDAVTNRRWFGRRWTVFRVVQYAGHVGGTALCIWMLWRRGRARWMQDRAQSVPTPVTSARSHAVLWTCTAAGFATAWMWVHLDPQGSSSASDILRRAAGLFAGLTLGAVLVRHSNGLKAASPLADTA
jgi:hypothetical protein